MAALDSAMLDTDETSRIEGRCDSMKLIIQIAAGIALGIAAIAWLSSSSMPTKTIDMSEPLSEKGPLKIAPQRSPTPPTAAAR
jgi:hypothetical protein